MFWQDLPYTGVSLGCSGASTLNTLLHEMRCRSEWELLRLAIRLRNTVWEVVWSFAFTGGIDAIQIQSLSVDRDPATGVFRLRPVQASQAATRQTWRDRYSHTAFSYGSAYSAHYRLAHD